MKRARPPLSEDALGDPRALLTTLDVSRLLRVHPKHVYRLLRRGLPGQRIGGEWRFVADAVLHWSGARTKPARPDTRGEVIEGDGARRPPDVSSSFGAPPLLAANGDVVVERLLAHLRDEDGAALGLVQADRGEGLELLRRGAVLATGCHGDDVPARLDGERLAFIYLVDRDLGLALRPGVRVQSMRDLGDWRLASRPATAGARDHFDEELRRQGLDPVSVHARAAILPSHHEVVCAVARGEADVGLASLAWARRVGLDCVPLCRERYGLLVRARSLGDPRVARLCEVAEGAAFRRDVERVAGYRARRSGLVSYRTPRARASGDGTQPLLVPPSSGAPPSARGGDGSLP